MTEIKHGDTVRIHYTGTLLDGKQVESSEGRDPLEFEVGSGQVISGLDAAVIGMSLGATKRVELPCAKAYGPVNPAMCQSVQRDRLPQDVELEIGTKLTMRTPEGREMPVSVVEILEETVTLDANHPLAGQDLIFEIEIVSVN